VGSLRALGAGRRIEKLGPRLFLLLSLLIPACKQEVLERPPGYIKVGKLSEFKEVENFKPDMRFLIIKDDRGIAALSTLCTYDLTPLRLVHSEDERVFVSDYTSSRYTIRGKVTNGPSVADLPYYHAVVDSELLGGPKDTLYVHVGKKRDPEWRAPLPQ